ncbi:hypothetical protein D018_3135A, partial [Vibrio parahaemolyticus VP2007-007]|jgi:hypothetical protein
MIAI